MRLIDVPNGSIFRLHDNLVLKTEYFSRVDDVYIPDCYIIGTGERFCGGMKTKDDFKTKFNDLEVEVINVLPDVSDTSSDTISRQQAIDLFPNDVLEWDTLNGYIAPHAARRLIEQLPTIQPETPCYLGSPCEYQNPNVVISQPEPQWILCDERMPEEHVWLGTKEFGTTISDEVYVTFETEKGERFCQHMSFQNGELSRYDQFNMDTWFKGSKPIAWMPLPEPYGKEDGQDEQT